VRKLVAIVVVGTLTGAIPYSSWAQSGPEFRFQFTEKPGAYSVGFQVVEQFDRSRTFLASQDVPASADKTENPRPLQTLFWYPAQPSTRATMTFGDYAQLIKTETSYNAPVDQGKPQSFVEAFFHGTTDAHSRGVRDAAQQSGKFPVVIYAPSVNAPATENIELCEYLASVGFVVIASPSMGASSRQMTIDLDGANAEARDISFILDFAKTLPNADISAVAVVGYSWGAMGALFAAARDKRIDALVSLDGSFRYAPETVQQAADVHPGEMTIPLLVFSRAEESLETWDKTQPGKVCVCAPSVLNEWTHGDLIHVSMLAMSHIQFSSIYQRSERFRKEAQHFSPADYSLEEGAQSYGWIALYTRQFLSAYLKHDPDAQAFLARSALENGAPRHLFFVNVRKAAAKPQ
jgi:pimeloyl-ACP methyl ester carboxylesterase